jgi:hypothetical protein
MCTSDAGTVQMLLCGHKGLVVEESAGDWPEPLSPPAAAKAALTTCSFSNLWNFLILICEDALLCDTTSSPAAALLPPAAPAASSPA